MTRCVRVALGGHWATSIREARASASVPRAGAASRSEDGIAPCRPGCRASRRPSTGKPRQSVQHRPPGARRLDASGSAIERLAIDVSAPTGTLRSVPHPIAAGGSSPVAVLPALGVHDRRTRTPASRPGVEVAPVAGSGSRLPITLAHCCIAIIDRLDVAQDPARHREAPIGDPAGKERRTPPCRRAGLGSRVRCPSPSAYRTAWNRCFTRYGRSAWRNLQCFGPSSVGLE